ncbi:MAG: Trm112 family protein [Deltaproteobacteria bacterium]|nr:Trm112 family protein [Deltaproteobacteria bacterium]
MTISKELLAILVCPQCKGNVRLDRGEARQGEEGLICDQCKLFYEIKDGIPIMLIDEARKLA